MEHPLRERTYDQRLVEAAIKPIQSPEDTGEQEFEPDRNTLQHCEVIRHWIFLNKHNKCPSIIKLCLPQTLFHS